MNKEMNEIADAYSVKREKFLSIGIGAHGTIAIGISAHGVVAFGVIAHGIVSVGVIAMGVFSMGLVSMGLLTSGLVTMGLKAYGPQAMELMQPHNHEMDMNQDAVPPAVVDPEVVDEAGEEMMPGSDHSGNDGM
jgi:hypothetical protein